MVPLVRDFYLETAQMAAIVFSGLLLFKFDSAAPLQSLKYSLISLFLFCLPIVVFAGANGCITWDGLGFFLSISVVTLLFVYGLCLVGFQAGLKIGFKSNYIRLFLLLGILFLSFVPPLVTLRNVPHLYVYNSIWGWFPGPIYDEQITLSSTLLLYRGWVLLIAVFLIVLHDIICNNRPDINTEPICDLTDREVDVSQKIPQYQELKKCSSMSGQADPQPKIYQYQELKSIKSPVQSLRVKSVMLFFIAITIVWHPTKWTSWKIVNPLTSIEKQLGGLAESNHFRLIYDKDHMSDIELEYWLFWHEFHLVDLLDVLDLPPPENKIISVLYRDVWQKEEHTGAKYTSYVPVWNKKDQLHLDAQSGTMLLRHELVHVIMKPKSNSMLGANLRIGLTEGIAVSQEDPRWSQFSRDQIIVNSGVSINSSLIEQVMGFWGFYMGRPAVNYSVSGSFIGHLIQHDQLDSVKCAYGSYNFRSCFDDFDASVQSWVSHLEGIPADTSIAPYAQRIFSRVALFEKKCARFLSKGEIITDRISLYLSRGHYDNARELIESAFQHYDDLYQRWIQFHNYHTLIRDSNSLRQIFKSEDITKKDPDILINIMRRNGIVPEHEILETIPKEQLDLTSLFYLHATVLPQTVMNIANERETLTSIRHEIKARMTVISDHLTEQYDILRRSEMFAEDYKNHVDK